MLRWTRAALVAVVLGVPATAGAQVLANLERQLLPGKTTALRSASDDFWKGLAFLREEEDRQRSLNADITFGLSGDAAGSRSLFKLNTGISLSRGVFPSEVTVVSKLGLQLRDGQLQEDVTSLQITYDYHANHHVEYFAFAERFTDSFLSIQQRYEVGMGARVGLRFGRVGDWQESDDHVTAVRAGLRSLSETPAAAGAAPVSADAYRAASRRVNNIAHALRDDQTRLFLGLVVSAFAEIERAQLDVTSVPRITAPGDGAVASKVSLDAEQRYRLNVRPTIQFKPGTDVEIKVYPYFKLPLDGPRRVTTADGRRVLDYRRDVLSEMTWTIRPEDTGLESVALVFTFNHYFDNAPPTLPAGVIADALASGRIFDRVQAERAHRMMALSLKLKW